MNRKKYIVIIIIMIIIAIELFVLKSFKGNHNDIPTTGHWYGKPEKVSDISLVDIIYNDGKDYVSILNDGIFNYYAYDENGNEMGNNIINGDTTDIFNYIFENDLQYLNDYNSIKDAKWQLSVDTISTTCLISSKDQQPEWFNNLLEKLNVEEYGYLSLKS